ncbi:MAG: hypothetical protein PHY18_01230 [Dehalococcoidales bacterium]|nr:hypothetical protein [Dehalococcoidales bacterium]
MKVKMKSRPVRKIPAVVLILAGLPFLLSSCAPVIPADEYYQLQADLDAAEQEIDELTEDLAQLEADHRELQENYAILNNDCQSSRDSYQKLLERLEQSELVDISWPELKEFLEQDDTDSLAYIAGRFDCSGFAITLRDHAARGNIRCAYVEISFSVDSGHALNAFETTDMGLVYVDCTEADMIGYVKLDEPYGTISLDGVKSEFIACSGDPDQFWGPLDYKTHANPFSYSYYTDYQRRVEFRDASIEAYNEAVDQYNHGSEQWSYDRLTSWRDNINALDEDLGSHIPLDAGQVKNIESYWN